MNIKTAVSFLAAMALINGPLLRAAEDMSQLSAGKYMATLSPAVGPNTAKQIKAELQKLPGLDAVDVEEKDSSVYFTVKPKEQIGVPRLKETVQKVAPGVALGTPIMESPAAPTTPSNSGIPGY